MQNVPWHQHKNIVQHVLQQLVLFSDFAICREVCTIWRAASYDCSKHWYNWLRYNVSWRSVKQPDGSYKQNVTVLKTVPLHIQCFQRGLQRQIRDEKYQFNNREQQQRYYSEWLQRYTGLKLNSQKRLARLTQDAVQVAEMRATKKRRIMISKDLLTK